MADDDHLRSIHLDVPRRQDFRRAREALVNACGSYTRALGNRDELHGPRDDGHTFVQDLPVNAPPDVDHWLSDREAIYPLKVGINTVGRLPDNDVVIHGPYVSRRHCAILVHVAEGCELHDIASKNGTYVNGQRLAGPTPLVAGDEIRMCDRQLIFWSKGGPPARGNPDRTLAE